MDDKATQAYYSLLRAGLWADPSALAQMPAMDEATWAEALRIASRTGTLALVGDGVAMLPSESQPDPRHMQRLMVHKVRLMQAHARANAALRDTFSMITALGYKPVLLKGQALATYYADPMSRACGDIDIYVGDEQIGPLVKDLTDKGITCEEELNDTEKHIIFYHDGMTYELHRYSARMLTGRADRAYQQWWRQGLLTPQTLWVAPGGALSWTPVEGAAPVSVAPAEQNILYTFYHVYHHLLGRYRTFKQFCDLARMLHACRGAYDADLLLAHLQDYSLLRPWRIVGCYLHLYLGLPQADIPGYDDACAPAAHRLARMLQRSLFEAQKTKSDEKGGRLRRKLRSYRQTLRTAAQAMRVFPRQTLLSLWQDTAMGIRLVFSPANRDHTLEHYLHRTHSPNL